MQKRDILIGARESLDDEGPFAVILQSSFGTCSSTEGRSTEDDAFIFCPVIHD
jgi:hypothetical protein